MTADSISETWASNLRSSSLKNKEIKEVTLDVDAIGIIYHVQEKVSERKVNA